MSNSCTVAPKQRNRTTVFVLAFLIALLAIGLVCWIKFGMWSFRSSVNRLILERQITAATQPDDDEFVEEYEYPPFDQVWWQRVLTQESAKYRELVAASSSEAIRFASFSETPAGSRYNHWSFQLLTSPDLPTVTDKNWVRNPIDRFILSRIEAEGLQPSPPADRCVLGRRIWFGLTGLPPTVDEIEKFANDSPPLSYDHQVDDLMSRQEFGERWASIWLDLARYADSNGYEEDELKPYAFTFRDFVIWAMNEDLPFDKFIRWQIAGDILASENPLAVAATGFFTNAPLNTFLPQESERYDELDDQIGTMGRAMMGVTIGCARCHDHFYDPVSHREYHQLVAIFNETRRERRYLVPDGGEEYLVVGGPANECKEQITRILLDALKERKIAELDYSDEQKELLRQPIDPVNQEQALLLANCMRCLMVEERLLNEDDEPLERDQLRFDQLTARLEQLNAELKPLPPMGLTLAGNSISQMPILKNGNWQRKGEMVGPGFLTALTTGRPDFDEDQWRAWSAAENPSPRASLARWMTDTESGAGALVARVIVNRLWQHHFGQGLVDTPSDLGAEGSAPTHPELLEWLAAELVKNDWSLKHIHHLIVTSATYRQSSQTSEDASKKDPENQLLSHQNMTRLTAEMIRDAMLTSNGKLNRQMYGRPTFPEIPRQAILNTQNSIEYTWPVNVDPDSHNRRSIYLVVKRTIPVPMMNLFDAPNGSFSCDKRSHTTIPTQSLALMNSPFTVAESGFLAEQLLKTEGIDREGMVRQAFLSTLSREPTENELSQSVNFLTESGATTPLDGRKLAEFCHVLFMTNEFIYLN